MGFIQIIQQNREAFARGLMVTGELCGLVWTIGILGGTLLGVAGAQWRLLVGLPAKVASILLAGVPVIVFMFWLHYPLQAMLNVVIDPFKTAAAALSVVNVFLVADLVQSAIDDFPRHYTWAATVCGLTRRDIYFRIKLPILFRQIVPGLLRIQIGMLQATIFASLISVNEIFRICQRVNSEIYKPVEIYTILALLFVFVCVPLHGLAYYLRARFSRDLSER